MQTPETEQVIRKKVSRRPTNRQGPTQPSESKNSGCSSWLSVFVVQFPIRGVQYSPGPREKKLAPKPFASATATPGATANAVHPAPRLRIEGQYA